MKSNFSRRSFLKSSLAAGALGFFRGEKAEAEPRTQDVNLTMNYTRLAESADELENFYEVLIIGSGYGGSVMAARLSRHHQVALLERGREWVPGEFPETFQQMKSNLYCESHPLGLYSYHTHRDIDVMCGSGLGGTSLINAGVVIAPDRELFQKKGWPEEIKESAQKGHFESYYRRVENMLNAQSYDPGRMRIHKANNLKNSSDQLGDPFRWANIAVNIHGSHRTPLGDRQPKCHMCGNCSTGCNTGAKNTLNMNYLPLAKKNGARIFTQMQVSHIERNRQGNYLIRGTRVSGRDKQPFCIEARNVIVSAGTMGSNQILLRSQKWGHLQLSPLLGRHFSGNGDLLGLGFNGRLSTDMLGNSTARIYRPDMLSGATIYGIAEYRQRKNVFERYLIEEGNIPGALVQIARRLTTFVKAQTSPSKIYRAWIDFINSKDVEKGSLNHSMVYFGMGHDRAEGRLQLDHANRAVVHWPGVQQDPIFKRIIAKIKQHVAVNDATYVKNPRSTILGGNNLITVHPLGGCGMGDSVQNGVVNHLGQVFHRDGSLYPGLFVMDGSVIPTAVGVNPLLTISALAERAAENMELR